MVDTGTKTGDKQQDREVQKLGGQSLTQPRHQSPLHLQALFFLKSSNKKPRQTPLSGKRGFRTKTLLTQLM